MTSDTDNNALCIQIPVATGSLLGPLTHLIILFCGQSKKKRVQV